MYEDLLEAIANHRVGNRSRRSEPRAVKRQRKPGVRYSLNHEKKLVTNYVEVGHLLNVWYWVIVSRYSPSHNHTHSHSCRMHNVEVLKDIFRDAI